MLQLYLHTLGICKTQTRFIYFFFFSTVTLSIFLGYILLSYRAVQFFSRSIGTPLNSVLVFSRSIGTPLNSAPVMVPFIFHNAKSKRTQVFTVHYYSDRILLGLFINSVFDIKHGRYIMQIFCRQHMDCLNPLIRSSCFHHNPILLYLFSCITLRIILKLSWKDLVLFVYFFKKISDSVGHLTSRNLHFSSP